MQALQTSSEFASQYCDAQVETFLPLLVYRDALVEKHNATEIDTDDSTSYVDLKILYIDTTHRYNTEGKGGRNTAVGTYCYQ